jgi:hypothetical protein
MRLLQLLQQLLGKSPGGAKTKPVMLIHELVDQKLISWGY